MPMLLNTERELRVSIGWSGSFKSLQLSTVGPQLQELAQRMTEAVVKFELLSNDPKSTVRSEPAVSKFISPPL